MDAENLERLLAGDDAAFARLVEEHKNRVLNTCYRFLFNREDAGDVSQEVFIEVHRSLASFRREADLGTWIQRIAINKSLDLIRRKNRKKRIETVRSFFDKGDASAAAKAPETADPSQRLEAEERLRIIGEAMARLGEKQRIAFTLSKCDGIGNREIAEIMGLTLSAVDALIHRAKANLQKWLSAYFEKEVRRK